MLKAVPRVIAVAALLGLPMAQAGEMIPWRNHAAPLTFLFGNDFDSHQQSTLRPDGTLWGALYVRYTGVVTADGYPVASHADCNAALADCRVGWMMEGKPAAATFAYQPMHDHPMFSMPRADIPQPGSHSHFHWLGKEMPHHKAQGYMLQLTAKNRFCFIHHGADGAMAGVSCRDNGGVRVEPGIDVATHLNIVPGAAHPM